MAGTPTNLAPMYSSGQPSGQKTITSSPASTRCFTVLVSLVTMPSTLGRKVSVKKAIFTGSTAGKGELGRGADGLGLCFGPG